MTPNATFQGDSEDGIRLLLADVAKPTTNQENDHDSTLQAPTHPTTQLDVPSVNYYFLIQYVVQNDHVTFFSFS